MKKNTKYLEPVPNSKYSGFSHVYRNPSSIDELAVKPKGNYQNIRELIEEKCLKQFPNHKYLGRLTLTTTTQNEERRELTSFKYKEVFEMSENLGSWILNNNIAYKEPQRGMKLVGIISKNRYEWIVTDHACCLYGLTLVPLYQTFGVENMEYCLNHCGITSCFVTNEAIDILLKIKQYGNLNTIITFDQVQKQKEELLKKSKITVIPFGVAIQRNRQKLLNYKQFPVYEETVLAFSYTSGTTGRPKGAMISHGNILSNVVILNENGIGILNGGEILQPGDIHFSLLPLVHVFERGGITYSLVHGMQIVFSCGDITKLKDDMAFVKPHLFMGVPRIFHKIADGVQSKFDGMGGCSKALINCAVESKLHNLQLTGSYESCFYDMLVFSTIKDAFGGRLKLIISGGAPIKPQTYQFMKIITSTPMIEGYGLTESSLLILIQTPENTKTGHLGKLMTTWELKLADIPDMNYTSDDLDEEGRPCPRGEIWVRGAGVFQGYYKDSERTKEMITEDGWLRTGDVGMIFSDSNMIKVIDRKKNIFKLQQGQYIAPEKVQAVYTSQLPITEAFVYGDSTSDFLVAIVVGDKEGLIRLASQYGIHTFYEGLCLDMKFRKLLLERLINLGKRKGLKGFQQAKNIFIEKSSFLERGILTNTMKLRRFQARKCYQKQIKSLYEQGPLFS